MQRVTVTLDDELMAELDRMIALRGYPNRSEALRDLARAGLSRTRVEESGDAACLGALVYVYDHEARQLARRVTQLFHDHHDLSLATLHVHLDHASCMEIAILKGSADAVRHCADHVIAERHVRHGQLVLIPVERRMESHAHGGRAHRHEHLHPHAAADDEPEA